VTGAAGRASPNPSLAVQCAGSEEEAEVYEVLVGENYEWVLPDQIAGGNMVVAGTLQEYKGAGRVMYVGGADFSDGFHPGKAVHMGKTFFHCFIPWGGKEHQKKNFRILVEK
jgi:hypothetical protein